MADIEIYKVVYLPRLRRFICTKRRTDCNVHTVHTSTERVHRASAESSLIGVLSEPLGVIGVFVPHSIPRTTDFLVFIKFYLMFFFFCSLFFPLPLGARALAWCLWILVGLSTLVSRTVKLSIGSGRPAGFFNQER